MKQFAKVTFCGCILTAFILAVGIGGVKALQALDLFHPLNPHECLPCPCEDCVCYTKTVTVRLVVEYPVKVPNSWDKDNIEFHRNFGSWCCSNAIEELDALYGDESGICACDAFTFTLTEDSHDE